MIMRLAVCGKGGVGKTAVSSMLARALARSGRSVLAFDFDVNPGLEISVGRLDRDPRLSSDAVTTQEGSQYGHDLRPGLTPTAAALDYAAVGPYGLRVLSLGRIAAVDHGLGTTHRAVRTIAAGFDAPGWDLVIDMEAGTKDVFDSGYVAFVDLLVLVTDGSTVAGLTCRRLAGIAAAQGRPPVGLVLNRATPTRREAAAALADELGVALIGEIPDDEDVRLSDVAGEAVADRAPHAAALNAIDELAARLQTHVASGAAPDAPAGASPINATGG